MCGRFAYWFADPVRAWYEQHFGPPDPNHLAAQDRYNVAPTDPVVAVTARDADVGVEVATWGFPGPGGKSVFNARVEAAATRPLWAPHWGRDHAVVPVAGFYEWTGRGAARTPFFIRRTDDAPLLLAGLVGGPPDAPTVALLTCPPNRFMASLHDRMPVVLEPGDVEAWLHRERGWEALARPAPEVLDGYAVGKEVGDSRAEGPGLVAPVRAWF